jgi:hypothetical protein
LTTERIIETRSDRVIKEIPMSNFSGRPLAQFIETKVTHTTNNRPVYKIRIYDPVSDEVLDLKGMDDSSTKAFERIGEMRECPYCKFDNVGLRSQCQNCGAVL